MNYMTEYEKAVQLTRSWDSEAARQELESIRDSIRHEVSASYATLADANKAAMDEARDAVYRQRRADVERALQLLMTHSRTT